jgi:hypothetical protein
MPADNLVQLFDFEGNLERGFRDWLDSKQLEVNIGGSPVVLDEDYIGVSIDIGATTEHTAEIATGEIEYDQYAFSVDIEIRTRRSTDTPSSTEGVEQRHREIVALVRTWLAPSQVRKSATFADYFPYNEIQFMNPSGTEYDSSVIDYDNTTLSYDGQFSILPSAWPV